MKNLLLFIIFTTLLFPITAASQDLIRHSKCTDPFILHQADSIKQEFSRQGFVVVKEASMTMESEYELPVIIPLTGGDCYQFVFIGDIGSRLQAVRMFDWNEKQVSYQRKQWGDPDGNVISYCYTPQFPGYHMMKPVQINENRKKNLCGYVILLKKLKP